MDSTHEYNPIWTVDGAPIPCPSTYDWNLSDISASDAGRTEDTKMDKKRVGQCVNINLAWQNISREKASVILKAFQPQYITVCFYDYQEFKYLTSVFYVGDRSVKTYTCRKGGIASNVSFDIIERSGVSIVR